MRTIALAGNPNVGKSTVFNGLTGRNQHTGNWPGKTVASAQGGLVSRVSGALAGVGGAIRDWWNGALAGGGAPTVAAPELPQPATPEIAIPQAPSFGAPDEGRAESWRRGDGQGGQNISIYGNIVLPEVQKAEDFGEAMRSYLQGELSMMEGMA